MLLYVILSMAVLTFCYYFFSNVWQGNRKKANKEEEKEKIYVFGIEQHGTDDD